MRLSPGYVVVLLGSAVSGLATYAYQVVGVRALGDDDYAVVSVLWTVQYLAFAVLLYPMEGFIAARSGRVRTCLRWTMGLAAAVGAALWLGRRQLLGGEGLLAVVGVVIVVAYGAFSIVRGGFISTGQASRYAALTGGEALLRLVLTPAVLAVSRSAAAVACLLPVGPPLMIVLLLLVARWRPRQPTPVDRHLDEVAPASPVPVAAEEGTGSARRLAASTIANAGAQLVLASGPLLVPLLDGEPEEVTVAFVTLTAARLPVFLALGGLLSQRLPAVIGLARAGRTAELVQLARRTAAAGVVLAVLAGGFAAWLVPPLLELLMGSQVRPPALVAALISAGVVLALAALLVNQIVTVLDDVRRLVLPWVVAVAAAAFLLAVMPVAPLLGVAAALVVGEALGLLGLVLSARAGSRSVANLHPRSER